VAVGRKEQMPQIVTANQAYDDRVSVTAQNLLGNIAYSMFR